MHQTLAKTKNLTYLSKAIFQTLSFFHIYKLPLTAEKIWQLLYRHQATLNEVQKELTELRAQKLIACNEHLYSLKHFDSWTYHTNQQEIKARWQRIKNYYWLLSAIPFVEHVSVINSVAMGNADSESDIDFFVITKPNRIYFVRTSIIILFRLLGVYKTRNKVNKQFCFGFYISSNSLELKNLLLEDEDPYMVFWLGTITPILGEQLYQKLMKDNKWIYGFLPNFRPEQRLRIIRSMRPSRLLKFIFTTLSLLPAIVFEPILRSIHIRHTFRLPENHWATSSTIANKQMLKLHALDPRKDLRAKYYEILSEIVS